MKISSGVTIFQKNSAQKNVLKDLIHVSKWMEGNKTTPFSFVEAQTSLIPGLTLLENLQLEIGTVNWELYKRSQPSVVANLINFITDPNKKTQVSQTHEKLIISLLKGISGPAHYLLVDCQEATLSAFVIKSLKETLMKVSETKSLVIGTNHPSLWLDCAHRMISRKENHEFHVDQFDVASLKKHWAA
jgi:ABC-type branched-subunit amino acid transport system ATPase component